MRSQARLDMGDREIQFLGRERAGSCRVHIANDGYERRHRALDQGLVGDNDIAKLFSVAAAANSERIVRNRQAQIPKEYIGHGGVVMLPGMHQNRFAPVTAAELMIKRRHLHEVRPRARDEVDFGNRHFIVQTLA